jgi:HEAT repeat protein
MPEIEELIKTRNMERLIALKETSCPRIVDLLLVALKDSFYGTREYAAKMLGKMGDPRAIEPLLVALADRYDVVHLAATAALVELGKPSVEPLCAVLSDANGIVRAAAVEALGKIGNTLAVESLCIALNKEDWESARQNIARVLGQMEDVRAVGPLIESLRGAKKDELFPMSAVVPEALTRIGKRGVELMIAALNDDDRGVRLHIATALGNIRDKRAIEPLLAVLQDDADSHLRDPYVRLEAAMALEKFRDEEVIQLVIPLVQEIEQRYAHGWRDVDTRSGYYLEKLSRRGKKKREHKQTTE